MSGLADVDAIVIAVSRRAAMGELNVNLGVVAVTMAAMSNTVSKGLIALGSGGRRFGKPIALVFAVAIVAGLVAALVS